MFQGGSRIKHFSIAVEDELEVVIDFRDAEEETAMFGVQKVNDHGIEGDTDDINIFKFWGCPANGIKGV